MINPIYIMILFLVLTVAYLVAGAILGVSAFGLLVTFAAWCWRSNQNLNSPGLEWWIGFFMRSTTASGAFLWAFDLFGAASALGRWFR